MKERKRKKEIHRQTEKICVSILNHFIKKLRAKRKQERENYWLKKEWMNEVKEKQIGKEINKERKKRTIKRKKERLTDRQTDRNK